MTKFEKCSLCGKKIGWFRKWRGDTSCTGMIPSNQFCSGQCYEAALKAMLNQKGDIKWMLKTK